MQTPTDFWRDIPGTDGMYQASRAGEIRRVLPDGRTRIVKPCKTRHGKVVVNLSLDGRSTVRSVCGLMGKTWFGPLPPGMVYYRRAECAFDNGIDNIIMVSRSRLGKLTGGRSSRKCVEKIDAAGNVLEVYGSAKEAARQNHMSSGAVQDRIHGRLKRPFAASGFSFRYERGGKT